MDHELLLKMLEASTLWLRSDSTYIQLKVEYVQCHIRRSLVTAEIEKPSRAYTKKEMSYMRKKATALAHYEEILEKQMNACYPGTTLSDIFKDLMEVYAC